MQTKAMRNTAKIETIMIEDRVEKQILNTDEKPICDLFSKYF